MYNVGIQGKIHKCLEAFLKNRQQQVRIEDEYSSKEWVKSGVPQGSVLGLLLFIIMMLDTDVEKHKAEIGSFADDTKIWKAINDNGSKHQLQQQLQIFYDWAHCNNMKFNDDKFEALYHGKKDQEHIYLSPEGTTIPPKQSVKDLGVYMSTDGKFKTHIQNIVITANKLTAWCMRVFTTRNTNLMITL